jgi:hypothetical protein
MKKTLSIIFALSLFIFFPTTPIVESSSALYGTFFYVWYEGYGGTSHFNGTPPSPLPSTWWTVVDVPLSGWYYSNDSTVIKQQFSYMHDCGINFVLISWWNDTTSDNATWWVFNTMSGLAGTFNMKLALSIEPINESGTYDFGEICDYVYGRYVEPFSSIYMNLENKPLLTWYQGGNMTGSQENRFALKSDNRFTHRITGDNVYCDWYWWYPSNEYPREMSPKLSSSDFGQTTVEPRYDDSRLGVDPSNGLARNTTADSDLSGGLYQNQWDIVNEWIDAGQCHVVLIGTWNDYTERTQIEPCFDSTSVFSSPFHLLDITKQNILGVTPPNLPVWLPIVSGVLGAVIASGIVTLYFLKVRKKIDVV